MLKDKKNEQTREKVAKLGPDLNFAAKEAYNLLRTNLYFSLPDKQGGKAIGITSACPQEGKSTTSVNIAYALAEAGHKVILVDADLRRPSVARVLELSKSPGLSNLLAGENRDVVHKDILHKGMSVVLSGDIPPNPSELVGSERMGQLLEEFRSKYDYIIIDLPPANSVADPIAISKYIDGIVIVVRHGHTRRREVHDTIRQLKFAQTNILGFVYNAYRKSGSLKKYKYNDYYKA